MVSERLVEEARARLTVSRLGKSLSRETDKDLLVIRRIVEALDAQAPPGDEREELSDMQCPEVDGSRRSHGRRERRRTISIEPLHDDEAVAAAVALRDAAQAARTGVEQLQLPEVDDDAQD